MGDFTCATLLDLAQCGDQIAVLNLIDRHAADGWEDVRLQALDGVLGGAFAPGRHFIAVPLARDFFEGVRRLILCQAFGVVAMLGGVDSLQHQAPRSQALFTRILQRNFRIRTKRQCVLLAVGLAKLPAPDAGPARHDFHEQAAAVGQLVWFILWFGVFDLEFGQRDNELCHGGLLRKCVWNHYRTVMREW